ncbi:MAG: hypothetical protein JWO86_8004 [Myxococcaceae bacterium]|jgi:ankyrin repeat protein|nr:hypothetical protein [Myxococcaceae bacterium]MEA2753175.1 hypothetical protein [Myxococcales bacterium]
MMPANVPEKWKWLFLPLRRTMRWRLEVTLGVVLSGAAMVALSTVIPADPSKVAAKTYAIPMVSSAVDPRGEADLRAELPPAPKVPPVFAAAVGRGDLTTMTSLYTAGMALDGMLSVAAESGDIAVAQWLLAHDADVHEDEGTIDAPVLLADEHPDMVAFLLQHGAVETSLVNAAQAGAKAAVLRLLAAHASVKGSDPSPLYAGVSSTRASAENKELIIEKLLAAGADPNADEGESALSAAVRTCDTSTDGRPDPSDCLKLMKQLLKHGARTKGDTLLAALAIDESAGRDTVLDTVLAARIEPGATAVALAQTWNPPPRAVKLLIAKHVDWAWHDGEDDAALPLLAAVQRGDRDYVRTLLDAGAPADVHFKDGTSPLGEAIGGAASGGSNEYARIVELLVSRGVDVNRRLPDGRTPLFAAAESGELRVINALLQRGARVNDIVLDDTALDAAEQNGHQPAARVLHAHGARRAPKHASPRMGDSE